MSFLLGYKCRFVPAMMWALLVCGVTCQAAGLRVDLNPPERRTDLLTPHWENWAWHEGKSGSQPFGSVTVTFRTPEGGLAPVLFKGLLDYGAHMGCDGIVTGNSSGGDGRSEERRVGKECRSRWS